MVFCVGDEAKGIMECRKMYKGNVMKMMNRVGESVKEGIVNYRDRS